MKCVFFVFAFIFLSILRLNAITLVDPNYETIRGVQIFNLDKKYLLHMDDYFETLSKNNVNTVFIRVFQNSEDRVHLGLPNRCGSGVYFNTDVACTVFDIIDFVTPYAKKYHIKVYAWMATRSLSFLKSKGLMEKQLNNNYISDGYGVDIFHPEVRNTLLKIFRDLAKTDIDGILIQDDFILKYNEGFGENSLMRYMVDYGKKPDIYDGDWYLWKMKSLSSFLNEIRYEVKKFNPRIKFAVNIYYETPSFPEKGVKWYAQTLENYYSEGFEYFATMAYHEQIMDELKIPFLKVVNYISAMLNDAVKKIPPERILTKIQIRKFTKEKEPVELYRVKKLCSLAKSFKTGVILVPFEDLADLNCFKGEVL